MDSPLTIEEIIAQFRAFPIPGLRRLWLIDGMASFTTFFEATMSICFALNSALSPDQTKERISQAQEKYGDILRYFWISKVGEAESYNREDDAEFGFEPKSTFLIQWNKERSELIRLIPVIFYDIFGKDNVLIRDNNYDVVPPP